MSSNPLKAGPQPRLLDKETGIVRWVSELPLEPGEPEIFNFSAKMSDTSRYLPLGCFDSNGGAGLSRQAAYNAALGEAVERYCSSVYFPDDLILASAEQMQARGRALLPEEAALFHPQQKDHIRYAWFTADTPLCWTQATSLTTRQPVWLPACMVYVPYYPFWRQQGEVTITSSISTGQAAGADYRSAVLGGLYEVVERDAFMIAWRNRLSLPRLAIESSPKVAAVYRSRLARDFLEYHLFDMTTDLGIPAIACMVVDHSRQPAMICFGGAANLDPELAALKALVEAAQTRQWARFMGIQKSPVVLQSDFADIDDFEKHVFLYAYGDMHASVQFLLDSPRTRSFEDLPGRAGGNPAKDLREALARVEAGGYESFVVDLTALDVAECGYRVVKVLVPRLQPMEGDHNHPCLGGERLYSTPRRMGYAVKNRFETLNPDPHPYP